MDLTYICELQKFLNKLDMANTDKELWLDKHLSYIPNKKLYRYRRFKEKEVNTLKNNSIVSA